MVFTIVGATKFGLVTHVSLRKSTQVYIKNWHGKSRKEQTDKADDQSGRSERTIEADVHLLTIFLRQ